MKTRINDLARELEVKSREILESLKKLGIAGTKTHSSSLEADEVEKVRKYFVKAGATRGTSGGASGGGEFHPKIDLSKISKPGDVLRALTEQRQPSVAKPEPPAVEAKTVVAPPRVVVTKPAAVVPPKAVVAPPKPPEHKPRLVTPASVASAHQQAQVVVHPPAKVEAPAAPAVAVVPPAAPVVPAAPAVEVAAPKVENAAAPVVAEATPAAPASDAPAQPAAAKTEAAKPAAPAAATAAPRPAAPQRPGTPIHGGIPGRRMIVPQTGPRPVYKAPPPRPAPTHPTTPAAQRGTPIFQRPGGPRAGGYQRPGGPRPMHPTRTVPTPGTPGYRPGGAGRPMGAGHPMGAAGAAPGPSRPVSRTPSRRPGQRYVPKGRQEGPMKGFVPPPRLSMSSEPLPITRTITIADGISVKDMAEKLGIRAKDLIARLLARGVFATINQNLDTDLAKEMARQFGADTTVVSFEQQVQDEMEAQALEKNDEAVFNEVSRAPVVTIMGHVDHGKTSLLDAIRLTDVASGEAGGITQHIGAYKVKVNDPGSASNGRQIVFLDTPGHEAFTRMRARGAKGADIVILVVAADDGVMPQTLEAVDHAKAAKVPIIVAVNKIDKPGADPDRVKKQLADRGLLPEAWGGDTVFVDVSAKAKTNLSLLLEMICLVADMQNLKATPDRLATGVVLEAKLDRGRGPVATVLVDNGTLKSGETFVVGNVLGKVRAMFDDRGRSLEEAGPSTPVEILGLDGLPQAGDKLIVVADRDKAREISEYREQKAREAALAKSSRVSLEGLAEQIKSAGVKELPVILKGDVQGSVEVIGDMLNGLSAEKVKINLLRSSVGAITESDVLLASASNAVIIGFNVRPERKAADMAVQEKVDIRLHSIIYELEEEIKKAMAGLLEPIIKETYVGRAEVKQIFRIPKIGTVAGCQVSDGVIRRDADVRLLRDGEKVFQGRISALKRFKDDAKEVSNGMECGISLQGHGDIKVGDIIESFTSEKIAATL
jgi:translation initiation factor IF-2